MGDGFGQFCHDQQPQSSGRYYIMPSCRPIIKRFLCLHFIMASYGYPCKYVQDSSFQRLPIAFSSQYYPRFGVVHQNDAHIVFPVAYSNFSINPVSVSLAFHIIMFNFFVASQARRILLRTSDMDAPLSFVCLLRKQNPPSDLMFFSCKNYSDIGSFCWILVVFPFCLHLPFYLFLSFLRQF